MRHLRQLLNDSVIYGLGGAFSKSIALLTLPILTRIFSPKDFGEIEMLSVIGSLLAAGLNLGLDSAQSKFFSRKRKLVRIARGLWFRLFFNGILPLGHLP